MANDDNLALFGDRVERLSLAHDIKRRRSLAQLDREERAPGSWLPLSKVLLIVAICIVLKALAISHLSEGAYRTHVLYLDSGSTVERLVGVVLAPDRFSLELSRYLTF